MSWSYLQLCNAIMCSILASYAHAMQRIHSLIIFPSPSRRNDKRISSARLSSMMLPLPVMDSTNEDPAPRDTHDLIVEGLKIAGVYMKHDTANRSDSKIVFNEGERVWLSTEHLRLHNQPSKRNFSRDISDFT